MIIARRSLLLGLGSLIAAPAIVRASSLMPVRSVERFALPFEDYVVMWRGHGTQMTIEVFDEITGYSKALHGIADEHGQGRLTIPAGRIVKRIHLWPVKDGEVLT